jgi:hypothetical protein
LCARSGAYRGELAIWGFADALSDLTLGSSRLAVANFAGSILSDLARGASQSTVDCLI